MAEAHRLLDTLLDQWKTGHDADLRVFCESGTLKVSLTADLGRWRAQHDGLWPKIASVWGFKESPSRQRRREKRAAERAQSLSSSAECVANKAVAEKALAAEKTAENAVDVMVAMETVAEEAAAAAAVAKSHFPAEKTCKEIISAESVEKRTATVSTTAEEASTSSVGSQLAQIACWNCAGAFTPDHQCDASVSPAPAKSSPLPSPCASPLNAVAEQTSTPFEGLKPEGAPTPVPLPLCHYCCHKGSGMNPVHYIEQCLCTDRHCSCQCYCTEDQLKHKKQWYPSGWNGMVCVPASDRPKARAIGEANANKLDYRGVPMSQRPCEDENCVKTENMK